MPHLVRLTLIGGWETMYDSVAILQRHCPNIHDLTVNFIGFHYSAVPKHIQQERLRDALRSINRFSALTDLALYGDFVWDILSALQSLQDFLPYRQALHGVARLVLQAPQDQRADYPLPDFVSIGPCHANRERR